MLIGDDDDIYEDDDDEYDYYPEPYECECGEVEYYCELCGFHGHDCPLDREESDADSDG